MKNVIVGLFALFAASCASTPETAPPLPAGGLTEWVTTPQGRLKARVYATPDRPDAPILIVALHGDIPDPAPSYQFYFAQAVTEGYEAVTAMPPQVRERLGASPRFENIVAAGVLRPGYTDADGDRSDGDMARAVNDNFTPEVVDAVATVIERLRTEYRPRAVILVGHSGGAAISANILGRHPGLVDGAVLVACGCDPDAFYAHRRIVDPDPYWELPNPSLRPLALIPQIPTSTRVRLVVGDQDELPLAASRLYARELSARGVDVQLRVEPGLGHNIMFTAPVFETLAALVTEIRAD